MSARKKLLIEEEKHVLVGQEEFKDFALVTLRELFVCDRFCNIVLAQSAAGPSTLVENRIVCAIGASKRQTFASFDVFSGLFNTAQKELLKLVPLLEKVGLLRSHVDSFLPLIGKLLLYKAQLTVYRLLLIS